MSNPTFRNFALVAQNRVWDGNPATTDNSGRIHSCEIEHEAPTVDDNGAPTGAVSVHRTSATPTSEQLAALKAAIEAVFPGVTVD